MRVNFQRFLSIGKSILGVRVRRSQHQPHIFHVRRKESCLLAQLPRRLPVAAAQGFTRFNDVLTGFDVFHIHVITCILLNLKPRPRGDY